MPDASALQPLSLSLLRDALGSEAWAADVAVPGVLSVAFDEEPPAEIPVQGFERGARRLTVVELDAPGAEAFPLESSPQDLFTRFLDFDLPTRLILWAFESPPAALRHCLVFLRREEALFVDLHHEAVLVRVRRNVEAAAFMDLVRPFLDASDGANPALDDARLGRDLDRRREVAAGQLGPVLKWSRESVDRLLRQVLLGLRVLVSLPFEGGGGLWALGVEIDRSAPERWTLRWRVPSPSAGVDLLLEHAARFAPEGAGALSLAERRGLQRQFEKLPAQAAWALLDVVRLSAAKLRAQTQVAALSSEEREQASWRLALTDPIQSGEGFGVEDFYVYEPLRLDLAECGLGRLLEAVENTTAYCAKRRELLRRAGGTQLDLIGGLNSGAEPEDVFNWALGEAVRASVARASRERVAWTVAMGVIDLYEQAAGAYDPPAPLEALPRLFEEGSGDSF